MRAGTIGSVKDESIREMIAQDEEYQRARNHAFRVELARMSKARWEANLQGSAEDDVPEIRELYEAKVERRTSILSWRFGNTERREHVLARRFTRRHRLRSWRSAKRNIRSSN